MKNFQLVGLKSPGTVNLPKFGTIDLEKIDDTLAEKLFLDGIPFIVPVPQQGPAKRLASKAKPNKRPSFKTFESEENSQ